MPRFQPTVAEAHKLFPEFVASVICDGATCNEEALGAPVKIILAALRLIHSSNQNREALIASLTREAPEADAIIEESLRKHFESLDPSKARILCVTTDYDNDAMWGNYADSHRGCVLGFKHIKELSTPLLAAQPVAYSQDQPVVGSGLDFLLYGDTQELRKRTQEAVCCTKKPSWSYEKEWRAITWRRGEKEEAQFGDYPFIPEELESVTLGVRTSREIQDEVQARLFERYPSATLYRMSMQNGELTRQVVSQ